MDNLKWSLQNNTKQRTAVLTVFMFMYIIGVLDGMVACKGKLNLNPSMFANEIASCVNHVWQLWIGIVCLCAIMN